MMGHKDKTIAPTSTHTILHKKIHLHINSQYTAQKDTLPPHQPTQSCTKIYTAQINSHYTQKEKLLILLTSTHTKLHIYGSHHWSPQTTLQTFIDFDFIHDDVMIVRNTKHVTLLSTYTL